MEDDAIEGSVSSLILGPLTSTKSGDTNSLEDLAWADSCEGSVSSLILGTLGSTKNEDTISQGDLGWADSCEDFVPSLILDTLGSTKSEDTISQEDLAWADSCLIKDPPDLSATNWDSLTEALLDITSYQTDSLDQTPVKSDFSSQVTDIQINEEEGTSKETERSAQINEEEEEEEEGKSSDDFLMEEENVNSEPISNQENAFLPTYKGEMRGIDDSDSDSELSYPAFGIEALSTEDIFKVWDLEIPDEDEDEDEFIKQLKKALSKSYLKPIPYTYDDSGVWRDLKDESLDDLVGGIEGLSLSKKSG